MRFNPKANIGGGRISGGGGGAGGGGGLGGLGGGGGRLPIPIPGGLGIKGTILLVVAYFVLTQCFNVNLGSVLGGGSSTGPNLQSAKVSSAGGDDVYADCKTGDDANNDVNCARMAVAYSLEQFWETQFDNGFQAAPMVTFSGSTQTGCGGASSAMGPFYCPTDQTIYEDPSFYDEVLEAQLGGKGGDFVEPYVLGHEYGHHIQNVTGQMKNVRTQKGPDSDAVKLELQADCYAGVWAKAATGVADDSGVPIFESIDQGDITEAIDAANAVGDDHIQKVTQGRVNDSQWTHGSSEQRIQWFQTGYESGNPDSCDIWKS